MWARGPATRLEEQAIGARAFSAEDRAFLSDFYRTLAIYMPDPSQVDSVFGLYHGTVALTFLAFAEWDE
ncbi:MAG TPA: hypothetical protein VHP33_06435 [Polyangiaceae bacterium]|nr:hypothetical protein [Polyangiaceae bacterium]